MNMFQCFILSKSICANNLWVFFFFWLLSHREHSSHHSLVKHTATLTGMWENPVCVFSASPFWSYFHWRLGVCCTRSSNTTRPASSSSLGLATLWTALSVSAGRTPSLALTHFRVHRLHFSARELRPSCSCHHLRSNGSSKHLVLK